MQDRFRFNAIVSSYYDIDTPENYEEFEPTFYLKNVDVFCTGEIGIDYDTLLGAVKEQSKDLTEKEIGQIMQHFEDNSNSPECDFVTIKPDKILQCTGLKDKNSKLIYEGDIINIWCKNLTKNQISEVKFCEERAAFTFDYITDFGNIVPCTMDKTEIEVIGNIYENAELLEE